MAQVLIQHTVGDFAAWKEMFDSDPLDRRGSGVRRYTVLRSASDPNQVVIDLELDTVEQAEAMRARLLDLWAGPASRMLREAGATVLEVVESVEL